MGIWDETVRIRIGDSIVPMPLRKYVDRLLEAGRWRVSAGRVPIAGEEECGGDVGGLRYALEQYTDAPPCASECPVCGTSECYEYPHGLDDEDANTAITERGKLVGLIEMFVGGTRAALRPKALFPPVDDVGGPHARRMESDRKARAEAPRYSRNGYCSGCDAARDEPHRDFCPHFTPAPAPIPAEEWGEEDGSVLWWRLPVDEPPYCGTPMDEGFPLVYYTHWTRLAVPDDSAFR